VLLERLEALLVARGRDNDEHAVIRTNGSLWLSKLGHEDWGWTDGLQLADWLTGYWLADWLAGFHTKVTSKSKPDGC